MVWRSSKSATTSRTTSGDTHGQGSAHSGSAPFVVFGPERRKVPPHSTPPTGTARPHRPHTLYPRKVPLRPCPPPCSSLPPPAGTGRPFFRARRDSSALFYLPQTLPYGVPMVFLPCECECVRAECYDFVTVTDLGLTYDAHRCYVEGSSFTTEERR